jgi:hypothetical protein
MSPGHSSAGLTETGESVPLHLDQRPVLGCSVPSATRTGAEPAQIARAYAASRAVFGFGESFSAVKSLGIELPVLALIALHRRGQRLLALRRQPWLADECLLEVQQRHPRPLLGEPV